MKRFVRVAFFTLGAALLVAAIGCKPESRTAQSPLPIPVTVVPLPTFPSSVLATPGPKPTSVPAPTATPVVIPPPPGWPTDQPWPPQPTPPTPQPTTTSQPFPTPLFQPTPPGARPSDLQSIWFPYFPDPAASPQLHQVQVDARGKRWAQTGQAIDLGLHPGFPGPSLLDLHPSPDQRLFIADIVYGESIQPVIVDPSAGTSKHIIADPDEAPGNFLAWGPNSRSVIVVPTAVSPEVWLIDVISQEHRVIDFPKGRFGPYLSAAAYSPDGGRLADAMVYPAVYKVSENWSTEIGLREAENGERRSIVQIPNGNHVTEHSLSWSPDGHNLIWIVDVVPNKTPNSVDLPATQVQLWMADLIKNDVKMLGVLGEAVEYNHQAVWSPDGRYIAAVKVEGVSDGKDTSNNIYLFDIESGAEWQLTHFTNRRLSHLRWSPDGQRLAFAVSLGEYGEIWVTDLNGTKRLPIAGPAVPNAPFVWLP
jgi:Tol biopolymer transport system component